MVRVAIGQRYRYRLKVLKLIIVRRLNILIVIVVVRIRISVVLKQRVLINVHCRYSAVFGRASHLFDNTHHPM